MLRTETPNGQWGGADDQKFLAFMMGRASAIKSTGKIARVHAGKLVYGELAAQLIRARMLMNAGDGWLEGPEWVAAHLMSYLALQISQNADRPLHLISDERAAVQTMVGSGEANGMYRRLRGVTRLLPVPPGARIADIDAFRRGHRPELERFRHYVNELIIRDAVDAHGEQRFEERLREAERLRDHLTGEMSSFDWQERGLNITILAITTAAAPLDHAPWTFGAGLIGLGLTGAQAFAAHNRQRRAASSELVYATKVYKRWPSTARSSLW